MVKSLKKSLTLNIFVIFFCLNIFLVNFLHAKNLLYIYKNNRGNILITNIYTVNLNKNYKKVKTIILKPIRFNIVKNYNLPDVIHILKKVAQEYNLDYKLLKSVALVESNLRHNVVSSKGAVGVMQLMPETATRFGVNNLNNLEENIRGGARYLKYLLKKFNGNKMLAIAAYNAGENSIVKYRGVPPYPETKRYLQKVLTLYKQFLNNEKFF